MLGRRAFINRALTLCYTSLARSDKTIALPPLRDGDKRLYLCRHGETDWNVENRIQGSTDNALNANGKQQAELLSGLLACEPIELIASSNLKRASATADAVFAKHPTATRLAGTPAFAEMCFGDWEGQILDDFQEVYQSYLKSWRGGDNGRKWPGDSNGLAGESPDDVAARALAGLVDLGLLPRGNGLPPARSERHVLVAAHGRFNKILIAALRGDVARASDVEQGNTAINVLDIAREGGAVVRALDLREHLRLAAT